MPWRKEVTRIALDFVSTTSRREWKKPIDLKHAQTSLFHEMRCLYNKAVLIMIYKRNFCGGCSEGIGKLINSAFPAA